jgi:carboxypeptidase PM20D1
MWPRLGGGAKRVGRPVALAFAVLIVVMIGRTATLQSRQPTPPPLADEPVAANDVARHLAELVAFRTVSESREHPAPGAELDGLRGALERGFPQVHARLTREIVGEHALLYTWKGTTTEPPIILCAHQDVVPVEPGTEAKWDKPPFGADAGLIAQDAFVWGRGTLDDKGSLVAILEAVEALLQGGFAPKRTVHLAFGHDEEISGTAGAGKIVDLLASRGVHAEAAFDEGNPVVQGIVPSIAGPVAPVGIAEKGYLTVKLSVDLPGGHSATPASESAYRVLGRGIERLLEQPMPARLDGATKEFFTWAAPEMSFGPRMVMSNTWLTWPIVSRMFAGTPSLDASIRTSTAVTVVSAGVKDNVVPRTAEAQLNFRVLPGDTTADVLEHVRSVIADDRVHVEPQAGTRGEPTRVSRTNSRAFAGLAATVREVFPSAVVAPALFLGASDGRKYERVADDVYRFLPVLLVPDDLARLHGTNERLAITALRDAVRFYRRLVVRLAG